MSTVNYTNKIDYNKNVQCKYHLQLTEEHRVTRGE